MHIYICIAWANIFKNLSIERNLIAPYVNLLENGFRKQSFLVSVSTISGFIPDGTTTTETILTKKRRRNPTSGSLSLSKLEPLVAFSSSYAANRRKPTYHPQKP